MSTMSRLALFFAVFALMACTSSPQADTEPVPSPTAAPPFFISAEPTSEPLADGWPDYEADTLTVTLTAPYAPPAPVYDPCAIDPMTGNVVDGDCFPGIPVD